jgi:hypothetical protein
MAFGFTGNGFLPSPPGGGTFAGGTLTSPLLFSADNTHDIGASGATRPRSLYIGTDIWSPVYRLSSGANTGMLINISANKANFAASGAASVYGFNFAQSTVPTSGAHTFFTMTPTASTGQTASTEVRGFVYNTFTRTWATGALAAQREFSIAAPTYAFAGASTLTTAATLYVSGPPIAGANATITKSHPLWIDDGVPRIDSTTANGAVATVLGSVGPAGSNTTVQEWLTIDIGGNTRYIPCF